MARQVTGRMRSVWVLAGVASLALTGCEMGATSDAALTGEAPAATSSRLVDRDVEAPEIFQTEDKALWDGRPSLGGVWVASADAKDPERVILRNPANGKFVIGGLFRREEALPGPKLQLSSDAAEALGLLAGEPATISVTALRREEAPVAEPEAEAPLLDSNTEAMPIEGDVVTTAAAAIDAASPETATVAGSEAPPAKPTAKPAAKPAADTGAEALGADLPKTTQPAAASGRTIQVGIFSVEANAKRAVDVLKAVGIEARSAKETSQGKDLWSVTTKGDAATLATVKSAGFQDAYLLKR
ncbi:SPOR domain-containing protein [Stagnihabitans tardus]|uniref:SPOR domain-containing protein n=1 Tax=Stagnihabitans tardus TaxID=2699202 RepID=A0AAE5BTF6_9RHOB|nr:SPOR domain-containing protein [Stagnihabitans tardus]NBZ86122.1 SPOR domain-containing protein [Stagnihabitans tardus]